MLAERILAGLVLTVCVALLVRMALRPGLRSRCDRAALAFWRRLSDGVLSLARRPGQQRRARQAAQDAIRRAQGKPSAAGGRAKKPVKGQWDGNVYKPDAFGSRDDNDPPPPRRDLH